MDNNSTNIIKTNTQLSSQIIEHKTGLWHRPMEIEILTFERHKHMAG